MVQLQKRLGNLFVSLVEREWTGKAVCLSHLQLYISTPILCLGVPMLSVYHGPL